MRVETPWWQQAFNNAGWQGTEADARELLAKAKSSRMKAPSVKAVIGKFDKDKGILKLTLEVGNLRSLPRSFEGDLSVGSYYSGGSGSYPAHRQCNLVGKCLFLMSLIPKAPRPRVTVT
jgi:hypothetical protein